MPWVRIAYVPWTLRVRCFLLSQNSVLRRLLVSFQVTPVSTFFNPGTHNMEVDGIPCSYLWRKVVFLLGPCHPQPCDVFTMVTSINSTHTHIYIYICKIYTIGLVMIFMYEIRKITTSTFMTAPVSAGAICFLVSIFLYTYCPTPKSDPFVQNRRDSLGDLSVYHLETGPFN